MGNLGSQKCINPCQAKGQAAGFRLSGVRYTVNGAAVRTSTGCECAKPFRDLQLREERGKEYVLTLPGSSPYPPGTLLLKSRGIEGLSTQTLPVIPCDETFRHADSLGTKIHADIHGHRATFTGCQGIEDWLVEHGLVRHLPPKEEVLMDSEEVHTDDDALLPGPGRKREPPSEYLASPEELMLKRGTEDEDEWLDRIRSAMKNLKLTHKQKSAFDFLHPDSGERPTYEETAKRLRISVDSLKDRMRQVRKKLETLFPEFKHLSPRKETIKGLHRPPDRREDGFYYRSSAKLVAPLYRIDAMSGARSSIRPPKKPEETTPQVTASKSEAQHLSIERVLYYPVHNGTWSVHTPMGPPRRFGRSSQYLNHLQMGGRRLQAVARRPRASALHS